MIDRMFNIILLLSGLVVDLCLGNCLGNISFSEYSALSAIYTSCNGLNWLWDPFKDEIKWKFPSTLSAPCSSNWQGLGCSSSGKACTITSLTLPEFNLHGSLPSEIGYLVGLESINVYVNRIEGTLPTEIGRLTVLQQLYLDRNFLTGSLPTNIGLLTALQLLYIYQNNFVGTLPTEIGEMKSIQQLYLYHNSLTGSLPTEIGRLETLQQIDISSNSLSCPLPTELGRLTIVQQLYIFNNSFSASLPSEIGQLTTLLFLDSSSNCLTGSLPTEIGQLMAMEDLDLSNNFLSFCLPTELMQLTVLQYILLFSNHLSGSMPNEIWQLSSLTEIDLSSNILFGPLSAEIGRLTALKSLILYGNLLTGSLPSEIGQLRDLQNLTLFSNKFTGSLPNEIWNAESLTQISLFSNAFTGSIPMNIGNLTSLQEIYFQDNRFSGSLPSQIGNLTSLTELFLQNNMFTSNLPSYIGRLAIVTEFYLNFNFFSGSLPSEIGQLTSMVNIILSSNLFTNQVPSDLFALNRLKNIDLASNWFSRTLSFDFEASNKSSVLESVDFSLNMFSGSIPLLSNTLGTFNVSFNLFDGNLSSIFNHQNEILNLIYFDVSNNILSGPLPVIIRTLPSLNVVMLNSNCFTGSISPTFSYMSRLEILILDSYGSASECVNNAPGWLRWLIKGLFMRPSVAGALPNEIFQMELLATFHASGNALTGTLPDLSHESKLSAVSLGSNFLQGSIPLSWQRHTIFVQLDLSFNKLSGVLSSNLSAPLQMSANSSSSNETYMTTVYDLSVNRLSGDIPDSLYAANGINILDGNLFQCDETHMPQNDPNHSSYVCGSDGLNAALISWLSSLVMLGGLLSFMWQRISPIMSTDRLSNLRNCSNLWSFFAIVHQTKQVTLMLAGSAFLILIVAYPMLKDSSFSNSSTHTYQYGWVTTISYLHGVSPTALIVAVVGIASCTGITRLQFVVSHITDDKKRERLNYRMLLSLAGILLCHIIVTVVVNVFYVFAILVGQSTSDLMALQFLLGGFKLVWNSVYIDWSLKKLPFLNGSGRLQLTSGMKIFTFLVSPYVATFLSDSSCFRYAITGTPVVSASFSVKSFSCDSFCSGTACFTTCGFLTASVISTTTNPPWLYSYQCSSALLNNYVPVLVASYLVSGLFIPSAVVAYGLMSEQWIKTWVPVFILNKFLRGSIYEYPIENDHFSPTDSAPKSLFYSHQVMSKLVMNIAVLLTFGFAAPLLALIIAVDTSSNIFMWKFLVHRYLCLQSLLDGSLSSQAELRLESATLDSCTGLYNSWQLSIISVALFWTLVVFDMIGDVYGPGTGSLFVLAPILSLSSVWVVAKLIRTVQTLKTNQIMNQKSYGIELDCVSSPIPGNKLDLNSGFI